MTTLDPQILSTDTESLKSKPGTSILAMTLAALRLDTINTLPSSRKQITLDEVAEHDTLNDCWIIIYDRVYNITKFLKKHPGGDDVLLEYAGRDATLAFRGAGHSDVALNGLKMYELGELPMQQRIYRCKGRLCISNIPE